jgi:hypothetical protein
LGWGAQNEVTGSNRYSKMIARYRQDLAVHAAWEDRYEALPYHFSYLAKGLAATPEFAIDLVRTWYEPDRRALFRFEGGRLLHTIFPDFPDVFVARLRHIASSGTSDDIEFVMGILRNYNGAPSTHDVMEGCRCAVAGGLWSSKGAFLKLA